MAGGTDDEWPDISPRRMAWAAVTAIPLFAPVHSALYGISIQRAVAASIVSVPVYAVIMYVGYTRERGRRT